MKTLNIIMLEDVPGPAKPYRKGVCYCFEDYVAQSLIARKKARLVTAEDAQEPCESSPLPIPSGRAGKGKAPQQAQAASGEPKPQKAAKTTRASAKTKAAPAKPKAPAKKRAAKVAAPKKSRAAAPTAKASAKPEPTTPSKAEEAQVIQTSIQATGESTEDAEVPEAISEEDKNTNEDVQEGAEAREGEESPEQG